MHPSQAAAERAAKQAIREEGGGEVVIHRPDGTIRDSDTIALARDPNPSRDTKHQGLRMTVNFNFDERGLRKAVEKVAKDAVDSTVRSHQAVFDRMHQRYSGKPKATVLAALRTEARQLGWKASDKDLGDYAQAISDGTRVVVKPGKIR